MSAHTSTQTSLGSAVRMASEACPLQPITFILPASFRPAELLPGRLAMRADDARWLVSTILRKTANRDTDIWGCVRLHSDILRRLMDADHYAKIVGALERGGAIETAPHCAGVKAKGFRLAAQYLGDRCVRMPATDPRLIERIHRERERQHDEEQRGRWKPIHYALADEQRHVTIAPEVDGMLDLLPDHTRLCQDVLVSNIRHRQYPFSVGSTGRVFNAITGLKRELRSALRIDGQRVGSVDIVCAQPALLAMLLCQDYPPNVPKSPATYKLTPPGVPPVAVLPADVPAFCAAAVDGSLYARLCSLSGLDRTVVKLRFLVDVLAKRGRYPSAVEQVFRAEFPTVYRYVRDTNRDDHGTLIRLLQQSESALVVERVAPRLLSAGCRAVTLHDAIFSRLDSVATVEAAFQAVFSEIRFPLSLKREAA